MGDTNDGAVRDAKKLGLPKVLILGLQHMFAMFGATILVPILVSGYFADACGEPLTRGLTVSVTLFCAGFGTLLFHVCSKFKVPAFLGSSFAFLGGFSTVANLDTGKFADMAANDKVAYACGGVVAAGALYLVMALIIKLVGVNRVMRFLPPVVTGPIIICIGLSLAPSAISNASTNYELDLSIDRSCRYHYLQYLGKRHVQDHPDFDGCFDFLRGSSDHECSRTYESGWQCDHRI